MSAYAPLQIRVYCRVRPHLSPAVRCLPDQTSVVVTGEGGKEASFGYDRVFGPTATQDEIFASVSELVQSALDGYHVCLFSYGQTGAGEELGKAEAADQYDKGPNMVVWVTCF